jgi:hypothetical protein
LVEVIAQDWCKSYPLSLDIVDDRYCQWWSPPIRCWKDSTFLKNKNLV